jgi:hypothetical protein
MNDRVDCIPIGDAALLLWFSIIPAQCLKFSHESYHNFSIHYLLKILHFEELYPELIMGR